VDPHGGLRTKPLSTPVLSPSLADVDGDGLVSRAGFWFRIHLPGEDGGEVHEGEAPPFERTWTGSVPPGREIVERPPFSGPVHTDDAEVRWCAYAWPVAHGRSGTRAFYVDQSGEVWQCANETGAYDGTARPPPHDAAFPRNVLGRWTTLPTGGTGEIVGRDGRTWKRTP
jgi:hypothetical protein